MSEKTIADIIRRLVKLEEEVISLNKKYIESGKRRKTFKVFKLPIKDEIDQMIRSNRYSYQEIADYIHFKGYNIHKNSVARYGKWLLEHQDEQ